MTADSVLQTAVPVRADGMRPDAPPRLDVGPRHPLAFALTLTGLAGFLDAAAYVRFNHLYVSFMSGNSTHLGISLAGWEVPDILAILGLVCAFVTGAGLGTFIADHTAKGLLTRVLALESVLLLLAIGAALAAFPLACVMMIALAMGLQNVLHHAVGDIDVGRGYVTGMLFSLGQTVARVPEGKATWAHARTSLFNWLSFVVGATAGALGVHGLGFTQCLVIGTVLIAALLLVAWRTGR